MKIAMRVLGVLAAVGLVVPYATADEILPPSDEQRPLVLGLGAIFKDKPYRNFDDEEKWTPIPLIIYEGERFFFRAATFGWKFISDDTWEVAVIGEARSDGYDSSDAEILRGMDDRDMGLDAGAHVIWKNGNWGLKGVAVADVSGASDGFEMRGEAFYNYRNGAWAIRPSASLVYQSDDLVDYYYGVQNKEATAFRPAYEADEQVIARLQAAAAWSPEDTKWTVIFGLRYDFMGDEVDDSPITDDDGMATAFLAVGYKFKI